MTVTITVADLGPVLVTLGYDHPDPSTGYAGGWYVDEAVNAVGESVADMLDIDDHAAAFAAADETLKARAEP